MKLETFAALAALTLAATACDKTESPPSPTEPASPASPESPNKIIETNEPSTNAATAVKGANAAAIESITKERCAREERCKNVGAGKDYESAAVCQTKTREDWKDDLNTYECPGGIVQKELDECLEEIRNDDCNNPLDTLGRIAACRSSDICKAT